MIERGAPPLAPVGEPGSPTPRGLPLRARRAESQAVNNGCRPATAWSMRRATHVRARSPPPPALRPDRRGALRRRARPPPPHKRAAGAAGHHRRSGARAPRRLPAHDRRRPERRRGARARRARDRRGAALPCRARTRPRRGRREHPLAAGREGELPRWRRRVHRRPRHALPARPRARARPRRSRHPAPAGREAGSRAEGGGSPRARERHGPARGARPASGRVPRADTRELLARLPLDRRRPARRRGRHARRAPPRRSDEPGARGPGGRRVPGGAVPSWPRVRAARDDVRAGVRARPGRGAARAVDRTVPLGARAAPRLGRDDRAAGRSPARRDSRSGDGRAAPRAGHDSSRGRRGNSPADARGPRRVAGRERVVSRGLTAIVVVAVLAGRALAHPLTPALLHVVESSPGRFDVLWRRPPLGAPDAPLRPILPPGCTPRSAAGETAAAGALVTRWSVDCGADGVVGGRIAVDGLGPALTEALVRVELLDGRVVEGVLRAAAPELVVPARPARLDVFRSYARLGVAHILTGADHLLFVLGLLLLVPGVGALLRTITAFTAGHSITLSLVALGVGSLPSRPVELLIALTVLALAVELGRPATTFARRFPWAMALAFGLLHGLGFAGALREVGLPAGAVPVALFSFNAGIELGQLAFVATILVVGLAARRVRGHLPGWADLVPAYTIGSLAAFWCFERAAALFS